MFECFFFLFESMDILKSKKFEQVVHRISNRSFKLFQRFIMSKLEAKIFLLSWDFCR